MQENKNSISGIYDGYGFIAYIAKETFVESFKKKKNTLRVLLDNSVLCI